MRQVDLLILGDFPPKTLTGISLVNERVHSALLLQGWNVLIIDESAWSYGPAGRFLCYTRRYLKLIRIFLSFRVKRLYLNIPLSHFGLLRLHLVLFLTKCFSLRTQIYGHIHRGDIENYTDTSRLGRLLLVGALRYFGNLAVLSEQYRNTVVTLCKRVTVRVVPNTSSFESHYGGLPDRTYKREFLCVSNIIRTKGIADLVEAFSSSELADFHLTIAGNIYEGEFMESLKQRVTSNINFSISPSRNRVLELLKRCDCFVLPSWNEGQPLVVLEAMSLGIPVVATRVGDIPRMLGPDYPFLVIPRDSAALADSVRAFDIDPNRMVWGAKLRKRYLQYYSNKGFENTIIGFFGAYGNEQ